MIPKIFLTGATGFIGGEVLYTISQAHPDWQFTCLVREKVKGEGVVKAFPQVNVVYGDNDAVDLLSKEASKADIVIHAANSDEHAASAEAIIRGLNQRQSKTPAYYIHTSGAFALCAATVKTERWGDRFDNVYNDWDKIGELTSLPDHAPHRHVDKIVLAADPSKIRTAIVAPSVVYGTGRGPGKTKLGFLDIFLKHKKVYVVGKGDNIWHNIHVQDLSQLYLLLAEAAATGGGPATWNTTGYYLAENGSYVNREMLELAADIAYKKGLIPQPRAEFVTTKESEEILPWLKFMVGADSQGLALRGKKLLGWKPNMMSFEDDLPNALDVAARDMGLLAGKNKEGPSRS